MDPISISFFSIHLTRQINQDFVVWIRWLHKPGQLKSHRKYCSFPQYSCPSPVIILYIPLPTSNGDTPKSCLVCLLNTHIFLPNKDAGYHLLIGILRTCIFTCTWLYVIFYGHLLLITVAPCHWWERDPVLPYNADLYSYFL
jgi:hypothetical protein